MVSQEYRRERLIAAGVLAVVLSPCLIPCLYHLVLGHYQAALLYAMPAACCGLLYLGLLWMFGLRSAVEIGLFALIVCILCVISVPVVIKLYTKHHAGGAMTGEDYHAGRSAVTDLSSRGFRSGQSLVHGAAGPTTVL